MCEMMLGKQLYGRSDYTLRLLRGCITLLNSAVLVEVLDSRYYYYYRFIKNTIFIVANWWEKSREVPNVSTTEEDKHAFKITLLHYLHANIKFLTP